jgi:hypothetical protein
MLISVVLSIILLIIQKLGRFIVSVNVARAFNILDLVKTRFELIGESKIYI